MQTRPRLGMVHTAALIGGAITLLVAVTPWVRFAYRNHSLHLVLETTEALGAAVLAYVMLGRYRLAPSRNDLIVASALAVLAGVGAVAALTGLVARDARVDAVGTWLPLTVRLAASFAFAAAALLPDAVGRRVTRVNLVVLGGAFAVLVVAAAATALAANALPAIVTIAGRHSDIDFHHPNLSGHPAQTVMQVIGAGAYAVAALGFHRRGERGTSTGNRLLAWLAAFCALAAWARFNHALYPSQFSDYVYVGDLLRLAAYALLFAGAAREIDLAWGRMAELATGEERRRMARELHDGLAQELAFLAVETRRLSAGASPIERPKLEQLERAARRALEEARAAVQVLTMSASEPFPAMLAAAAEDVAARSGARLETDLPDDDDVPLDPDARQALVRIVREAVSNAARHGRAEVIRLSVRRNGDAGVRVRVEDDGIGFNVDAAASAGRGFGLQSMRERAQGVGGLVTVTSDPGHGAVVEVVVPA